MTTLRGTFTPRLASAPNEPVAGQRVTLVVVDEATGRSRTAKGYRAISGVYTDPAGQRVVRVATEANWHAWIIGSDRDESGECPTTQEWPAELVRPQ